MEPVQDVGKYAAKEGMKYALEQSGLSDWLSSTASDLFGNIFGSSVGGGVGGAAGGGAGAAGGATGAELAGLLLKAGSVLRLAGQVLQAWEPGSLLRQW
jgi:hypothetical protein